MFCTTCRCVAQSKFFEYLHSTLVLVVIQYTGNYILTSMEGLGDYSSIMINYFIYNKKDL